MMITEYIDFCLICGKPRECEHHLLRGSRRQLAEDDDLTMPMCDDCHNMGEKDRVLHGNFMAEALSKIVGQLAYEKKKCAEGFTEDDAREEFRRIYGKSWL